MSSQAWQKPFVNIFKHYGAGEWKKCLKTGDVAKLMDRTVKSSVYRLSGAIPSGNYIQFPKSKSLGLTGHFLYITFKPIVDKFYSIHFDVVTSDGVVIRISLSNLFKEFKSSSTWLQFPVISNPMPGSVEEATSKELKLEPGIPPSSARWTLLCFDVQYVLSVYLNKQFTYFRSIRFCSNMYIRNAFTSSTFYEPGLDITFARKAGLLAAGVVPVPSEMSFPLEKYEDWHLKYDYIKFPSDKKSMFRDITKITTSQNPSKKENDKEKSVTPDSLCSMKEFENKDGDQSDDSKMISDIELETMSAAPPKVIKRRIALGEKGMSFCENSQRLLPQVLPSVGLQFSMKSMEEKGGIHVYASPSRKSKEKKSNGKPKATVRKFSLDKSRDKCVEKSRHSQLLPDPILSLKKVLGFGTGSFAHALWSSNGDVVIYPCYGIIVILNMPSGKQDFLLGHNNNVSALALSDDSTLLTSAQCGTGSIIRIWNFSKRKCMTVFKSSINELMRLNFSQDGKRLCGVGEDSHFKQVIVVWNINLVGKGGKVLEVARAHTESSFCLINNIRFVPFDNERLVSCGNHNIRVWRIKSNVLRSCPVDLGKNANVSFTDFVFDVINRDRNDESNLSMHFTGNNGWFYKVDYRSLKIVNTANLHPKKDEKGKRSLNCIAMSEQFCAIGSEDGFLRLWPLNFKSVFLEAEHDSPISVVTISDDRNKVFTGTRSGNLGCLDITNRLFTTITRSHSGNITTFSFNKFAEQIATISTDKSIKLWDVETLRQICDFQATNEKPTTICCHPSRSEFACGFESGTIRFFSLSSSTVMYELKEHLGTVHSLLFHMNGQIFYSAANDGTLIMYEGLYVTSPFTVSRTLPECVTKEGTTVQSIALDVQGRYLAVIGTSPYVISLYGAKSLSELLHINVTCMVDPKSNLVVDEAEVICFSPLGTLLVATSTSRLLKFDCSSGQLLSETSNIHAGKIQSVCCSSDGKYLATAGDKCIKVWDYLVEKNLDCQVFIGHCSPIQKLEFSPDGQHIVSVGESLFVWNFLAERSVADLYLDDEQPNMKYCVVEDKAVKAIAPPEQIEQLGILELSSTTTRIDDGSTTNDVVVVDDDESCFHETNNDDLRKEENILDDTGEVDFNMECKKNAPEVIDIISPDKPEPEVLVPGIEFTADIITSHAPPQVIAHYNQHENMPILPQKLYAAPTDQAGMIIDAAVGCNSNGRHNIIWHPETGLFLYSSGCLLIFEVLETGKQVILHGHNGEISTLGIKNDGQIVASGGSFEESRNISQICIWDLPTKTCEIILEKHHSSIVSLQFSRDDRFLLSVSDYRECSFIVWCAKDYYMLSERKTIYPVHAVRWNPYLVNELCSVGRTELVLFWKFIEKKPTYDLEVTNGKVPREVIESSPVSDDMTSVCYLNAQILFTATSTGAVCAWNSNSKQCLLHWQADDTEIDVLAAVHGKLITGSISTRLRIWSTPHFDKAVIDGDTSSLEPLSLVMENEKMLDGGVVSASFDDKLEMGVIGTLKGTIWYINFEEESGVHVISGHHSEVKQVVICSGDDSYFATCSKDGSLRLWNSTSREQTAQFLVVGQECLCATFCSKPRESLSKEISDFNQVIHHVPAHGKQHPSQCAAGYSDGTVRVFDFGLMEKLMKMKPHSSPVVKILCPVDGRFILSGSSAGVLVISSMSTGLTIRVLNDHANSPISQISQQPGGGKLSCFLWLACSEDCRISVWNADWVKDICELTDWVTFPANNLIGNGDVKATPTLANFSHVDADLLIYTGNSLRKEICFYSLAQKKVLRTISLTECAFCMDVSSCGNLIVLGFQDRLVKLVDSNIGTFQDFVGHLDSVNDACFNNDGNKLVTAAHSQLLIWNILL